MNTKQYLDKIAKVIPSDIPDDDGDIYVTKEDDLYLTRVGMEEHVDFMAKKGITEHLQGSNLTSKVVAVGYAPTSGKWYGWSHRAIFGFVVGSTCKKGNCHYMPKDEAESIEDGIRFWDDDGYEGTKASEPYENEGVRGVDISWTYDDSAPNKKIHNQIGGAFWAFPDEYGKGEWTAETIEDAKKMAIDFAQNVG